LGHACQKDPSTMGPAVGRAQRCHRSGYAARPNLSTIFFKNKILKNNTKGSKKY
jgi:hypothetical protein